jgi:hypothetical protein
MVKSEVTGMGYAFLEKIKMAVPEFETAKK